MGRTACGVHHARMRRSALQRPSALVVACAFVVVSVFVASGDLRIERAAPATPAVTARAAEPRIVKRDAPPPPPAMVTRRGRVFDALGFLLVGAEVLPMDRPAARTDGDGSFQLELAANGRAADVLVRADGQRPAWMRTCAGSPDVLALQLVPKAPWDEPPVPPPEVAPLRGEGIVLGGDGKPLAGAYVTAVGSSLWARTDDIGRFALPLPAAATSLLVHGPTGGSGELGFAAIAAPFVSERARGVVPVPDLVALPALGIRGLVRDPRGQPIAGVPVEIAGESLRRVVDSGAGGQFQLGGLLPGRYVARPFAYRGAVGVASGVELTAAPADVELQLLAAEERRLRVVDEQGGAMPGLFVAASIGGMRRGIARADGDGFVAVPVAAGSEFDVRAPEHYTRLPVRRFDLDEATLVVALP
jgi:hypothetical protein